MLTNGDVDALAGLLCLREGQPLTIYGSSRVLDVLAANSIFDVLDAEIVKRVPMELGRSFAVEGTVRGRSASPSSRSPCRARSRFISRPRTPRANYGSQEGDTVGLKVMESGNGHHFFFIPGCARLDDPLRARLKNAPLVFFDGTLYTNDEMIAQGLMNKTGERIGHMNMSGRGRHGRAVRAAQCRPQDFHPHQ